MQKPCELELIYALIVNEQHVIQKPVIEQPFIKIKYLKVCCFFKIYSTLAPSFSYYKRGAIRLFCS